MVKKCKKININMKLKTPKKIKTIISLETKKVLFFLKKKILTKQKIKEIKIIHF